MMPKRGLGSGLGGLLAAGERPRGGLREVAVAAIVPNPRQPRLRFEPEALAELTASIQLHGVIQPLIVTLLPGGDYQLIAGERRWRAAQQAGLSTVAVIVKEASAQEQLEWALIENVQRADLDLLEEALAYQALLQEYGLTQEQVAQRVGKSRTLVAQIVGVLRLPSDVQQAISDGRLKLGHVRPLGALKDAALQSALAQRIVDEELTVRQVEALVGEVQARPANRALAMAIELADVVPIAAQPLADTPTLQRNKPMRVTPNHPFINSNDETQTVVTKLQQHLGMRVSLERHGAGGRLTLFFPDEAALDGLYHTLMGDE